MKINFYTSRFYPSCRAVKMLITHLNLPVNEIYVRPLTDTRTEEFRKINPSHTLPTIDDNGFILWESRAIMQYLCNKYAPNSELYPKDPQKRAIVERLLNFDLKTLSIAVMAAHFEFTFPNEYSASRGDKLVALADALTFLEIFLINKDYVAGDILTIADISLLANVTILEITVQYELSTYPNIWGWINRLRRELPYYDMLTKSAHDEFRELIRSIRDEHEEWSSNHYCAFMPCEKHNGWQNGYNNHFRSRAHPGLPPSASLYLISSDRIRFNDGETVRYVCGSNFQTYTQTRKCVSGRWTGNQAVCGNPIENDINLIQVFNCTNGTNRELLSVHLNQSERVNSFLSPEVILPQNSFHASRTKTGPIGVYGSACYLWKLVLNATTMMPFISIDFGTTLTNLDLVENYDLLNNTIDTTLLDVSLFVSPYRNCYIFEKEKQINYDSGNATTYLLSTFHFRCDTNSESDYARESQDMSDTIIVNVKSNHTRDLYLLAVFMWNHRINADTQRPDCGKPETVQTGANIRESNYGMGQYHYQCNQSFVDVTPNKIYRDDNLKYWYPINCTSNARWVGQFPVCAPKTQCYGLAQLQKLKDKTVVIDSVNNVYYVNKTYWVAGEYSVVHYSCADTEHLAVGKQVRVCLSNGSWSLPEPKCVAFVKPETLELNSQFPWNTIIILVIVLTIFLIIIALIVRNYVSKVRAELSKNQSHRRPYNSELYTDIRNTVTASSNSFYDDCQLTSNHANEKYFISQTLHSINNGNNQKRIKPPEYIELIDSDRGEPEYISILPPID